MAFLHGQPLGESPSLRRGDPICLLCEPVSPTSNQRRSYDIYRKSTHAELALLNRHNDYGLQTLTWHGWCWYWRRKVQWRTGVDFSVSEYLSIDAERRLLQVRRWPHGEIHAFGRILTTVHCGDDCENVCGWGSDEESVLDRCGPSVHDTQF